MKETVDRKIAYDIKGLSQKKLLELYEGMLFPRMIENRMLLLLRQGKISKWFSGIGQEAISVGATMAIEPDEYIFSMHRNLGVFTSRDVPLKKLVAQWQGKATGFSKGRDRSFHFGTNEHHIVGMISHLGPQLSVAGGVALAHKLKKEQKLALAFTGEGGTSEGEFHEAMNVASVWDLPVIFVIENNGYGLSTPHTEQYKCEQLADRAKGYGMDGFVIDGNNILEVYDTIHSLADDIRKNPRPVLVECMTFRMRGHEEASGTKYVPSELFDKWEKRDPISNFENFLLEEKLLEESQIEDRKKELKEFIKGEVAKAFEEPEPDSGAESELADVYAPFPMTSSETGDEKKEMRFIDALADAMQSGMERHDELILMGQDIADYGGVFKITSGLMEKYGQGRVRNTPLCESAILGIGLGLSIKGFKSMIEMQFADFVSCGMTQLANNIAKSHYRWGQAADIVVRMPTGAGTGAGPFHSQSNEAWFTHTAGLRVYYPSTPEDAKGLLLTAFENPNPVMFFEHKALYRKISGNVPIGYYTIPEGKARLHTTGDQVSVITYGSGVHWALEQLEEMGIQGDVLDLRTLVPLDYDAIKETVSKTGKVVILHEDTKFGGIGGEIASWIGEELFEKLDAPVCRIGSMDTPVPFAAQLEKQFLPVERFPKKLRELLDY
ncbi:MAG: dehydrogenase [Saprospirales bacterium]|nr:MAG: dehydrogenase [Saprospirales bacterium]